jgi:carbonyl reductase 1
VINYHCFTLTQLAVRQLALQYPKSQFNNGPLLVYLTARDQGKGQEALKNLYDDAALKEAKALKNDRGLTEVKYHQLDISETKSIHDLAEFLKKTHPDGIDFGLGSFNHICNTKTDRCS